MATCYICLRTIERSERSKDHVIPDCFLANPKPANLLTVPAHKSCHNQKQEEYVRNLFVALGQNNSKAAKFLFETKATRAFARNERLKREFRDSYMGSFESERRSLGEKKVLIRFDREIVYECPEKIVKGLYRYHTRQFLPVDAEFQWAVDEEPQGQILDFFNRATPGRIYPDVFRYSYLIVDEGESQSTMWFLQFYGSVDFRGGTQTAPIIVQP